MARPRLSPEDPRPAVVNFRADRRLRALWKRAAKRAKKNLSQWMRDHLRNAAMEDLRDIWPAP